MSVSRTGGGNGGDGGGGLEVRLTPSQLELLRRSTEAFGALVPDADQRRFVLGEAGADLVALFDVEHEPNRSLTLSATEAQLRAAHALLTTLLAMVPSERAFMERVGFFRENVAGVALGLRRGVGAAAESGE
ncbi:hypothetical protein ACFUN8_29820 [Streptomyces sp. NPDC057307]|uniref:hypothetical protein n=1 Tax=Streptomyces sp. NPDC057307 TaxID=3346096 RepID=UPI0036356F59